MVVVLGHVEAYSGYLPVGETLLHEVQLEVHTAGTNLAAVSGVVDILGHEYGVVVPGAEGLELLEDSRELGRNLCKVQLCIHLHYRSELFAGDVHLYVLVHSAAELLKVLLLHGETGGIDMPAEVFQKVCAALDRGVKVESVYAAGASGYETVALCEYDRRLVACFHKA